MSKLEDLKLKVKFLKREPNQYYQGASVMEAIDTLVQCCEFLLDQVEECEDDCE